MSLYIQIKYLKMVSSKLLLFREKKPNQLYNFRCPFCGDSKINKTKCRGFIHEHRGQLFYTCHNGCPSRNFYTFLQEIDSSLHKDYVVEKYVSGNTREDFNTVYVEEKYECKKEIELPKVSELGNSNIAKNYVLSRKIPSEFYSGLYYAEDFKDFVDELLPDNDIIYSGPRLVIPFIDKEGNLLGLQGRALDNSTMRYVIVKMEDSPSKIFGLDRVNENEKVLVLEGAIDVMSLGYDVNAVASSDSNLRSVEKFLPKENLILVYDKEPRNREIVKQIESSINDGFTVSLFPDDMIGKDVNEFIRSGYSREEVVKIIMDNANSKMRAKLLFNKWKKV